MPLPDIRMIVMDMDDTLLNTHHEISDVNREAIQRAQAAGITIVLASGRPTPAMHQAADTLGLQQEGYVISYNGAYVISWADQALLHECSLSKYECDLLVDAAHAQESSLHTYVEGDIVTDNMNPFTEIEAELTGLPIRLVDDLKTVVTGTVPKVLLVAEPAKVSDMRVKLGQSLGDRFTISISKPYFLEFTNRSVDKSAGISILCERLGIPKANVMAIGDSYNDLTMIRDCGVGVAMGNAPDDIKALADWTTAGNNDHGVAQMIDRVLESRTASA